MDSSYRTLPKELANIILLNTDNNAKRALRSTSRYWHSSIKIDEFKISFANPKTLPDIVQHFATHYENIPIGLSFNKIVAKARDASDFPIQHLAKLTHLTSLEVDFGSRNTLQYMERVTDLYTLTNLQNISTTKVTSTLTNLTSLSVLYDDEHLPLYSNLRHLDLYGKYGFPKILTLVANPSRLTHLQLSFTGIGATKDDSNIFTRFDNLKKFVKRCDGAIDIGCLTNLDTLIGRFNNYSADMWDLTQLTHLDLYISNASRNVEQISRLKNLKSLVLHIVHGEFTYSFLSSLTALEDFTIPSQEAAIDNLNSTRLTRLSAARFSNNILRLSSLMELYCKEYRTTDYNYDAFTDLRNLTLLHLATSNPHLEQFTILNQLESLKWLRFGENSRSETHKDLTLKNLTNLESLNFICKATKVYLELGNLTRLTSLQISLPTEAFLSNQTVLLHRPLRELVFHKQFYFMPRREHYYMDKVMEICTSLRELEHLEVWKVSSEEAIESLSVLTNLTYLALKRTRRVEGIHLTKLTSLQKLHFVSKKARNRYCKRGDFLTEKLTRLVHQEFTSE